VNIETKPVNYTDGSTSLIGYFAAVRAMDAVIGGVVGEVDHIGPDLPAQVRVYVLSLLGGIAEGG